MKYFFTSDFHLSHKNIIKYSNRPFSNIIEMNEAIVNNWNSKVGDNDIVFFLGDFCFGNETEITRYFKMLKGNIKVIFGNHDKTLRKFSRRDLYGHSDLKDRIEFLGDYKELTINDQFIVLAHYAFLT